MKNENKWLFWSIIGFLGTNIVAMTPMVALSIIIGGWWPLAVMGAFTVMAAGFCCFIIGINIINILRKHRVTKPSYREINYQYLAKFLIIFGNLMIFGSALGAAVLFGALALTAPAAIAAYSFLSTAFILSVMYITHRWRADRLKAFVVPDLELTDEPRSSEEDEIPQEPRATAGHEGLYDNDIIQLNAGSTDSSYTTQYDSMADSGKGSSHDVNPPTPDCLSPGIR